MQRDRLGKWIIGIMLVLVLVTGVFMVASLSQRRATMSIGDQLVSARIADTDGSRQKGLSGTTQLADNQAMLFIFPTSSRWGMWMKDMNYSLDMLWLDSGKKIVHVEQDVSPASYPEVFLPDQDARYVVELPAGFVARHGVKLEQTVVFSAS